MPRIDRNVKASSSRKLSKTFPQKKRTSKTSPNKKQTTVYSKRKPRSSKVSTSPASPVPAQAPAPAQRELDVLKQFDLTLEFGPCMGITRLERWERANKHGFKPPAEVKNIISKHADDEAYTQCLWNDYNVLK